MNDTKLLHLLKNLPRPVFLEFGRYLNNGFFTRDPHVRFLYKFLKKQSKEWETNKLEIAYVLKNISSKEKTYTEKQLRHIISDTYLQLENYLA